MLAVCGRTAGLPCSGRIELLSIFPILLHLHTEDNRGVGGSTHGVERVLSLMLQKKIASLGEEKDSSGCLFGKANTVYHMKLIYNKRFFFIGPVATFFSHLHLRK